MKFSLFLIAAVASCGVQATQIPIFPERAVPDAPIWPSTFTVDFQEDTKLIGKSHRTNGQYFYDAERGATLVTRENGRHDRYCGTVKPFQDTPCNHLTVGGRRYLVFPKLEYCCYCCADRHGCGIMRRDWLKGAEFMGEEKCGKDEQTTCYKWNQPGLQPNFYWEESDTHVPRRLFQMPNDDQVFDAKTFTESAISSDTFNVPEYCYAGGNGQVLSCPKLSACTLVRRG